MRETLVKSEEFKDSPVGRIPKDWEVDRLSTSITYGVFKPGEYVSGGIPLLQIQDVIYGEIEPSKLHRISKELDAQYARTRLGGGEIVMSLLSIESSSKACDYCYQVWHQLILSVLC